MDDHCDQTAITIENGMTMRNGNPIPRKMTKGWNLEILWKDGSSTCEPLCDIKESHPIEVAEYTVANKLETQPAFAWWVHYTLKKRSRIVWQQLNLVARKKHPNLELRSLTVLKEHWGLIKKLILGSHKKSKVCSRWPYDQSSFIPHVFKRCCSG